MFRLVVTETALTVHFGFREGRFESEIAVEFDEPIANETSFDGFVLSKDFVVAMQGIADLGVATPFAVELCADAIVMTFSTTAADYRVYVPTCSLEGVRNGARFVQYEPSPVPFDEIEGYNDQAEGDFEEH